MVRDDARGEVKGVADQMQVIAELNNDSHFTSWTCNEPSIGRKRIKRPEKSKPLDKGVRAHEAEVSPPLGNLQGENFTMHIEYALFNMQV